MIVIPFDHAEAPEHLQTIRRVVAAGGVIVYPTDTLYGMGGDFFQPRVAARIDTMKGRGDAPYSVAAADIAMVRELADPPPLFSELLAALGGERLTFLLSPAAGITPEMLKGSTRIGVRLPDPARLRRLIAAAARPWITTSVNTSGCPPLTDPQEIRRLFPDVDLLLDAGPLPPSAGSTIVDLTVSPPCIVRPGARQADVLAFLAARS